MSGFLSVLSFVQISLVFAEVSETSDCLSTVLDEKQCGLNFIKSTSPIADAGLTQKIYQGRLSSPGAWPWMAAMFSRLQPDAFLCGGTVLSPQHILTAAHCVYTRSPVEILIRLGEHDFRNSTEAQSFDVGKITFHPEYNPLTSAHDLAIVVLKKAAKFGCHVNNICLPSPTTMFTNRTAISAGWGKTELGEVFSQVLREIELPIQSEEDCREAFPNIQSDIMMCAGRGVGDTCQGDSGGPLMIQVDGHWTLLGVVSFGAVCGKNTRKLPGVYARVDAHLGFVNNILHRKIVFDDESLKQRVEVPGATFLGSYYDSVYRVKFSNLGLIFRDGFTTRALITCDHGEQFKEDSVYSVSAQDYLNRTISTIFYDPKRDAIIAQYPEEEQIVMQQWKARRGPFGKVPRSFLLTILCEDPLRPGADSARTFAWYMWDTTGNDQFSYRTSLQQTFSRVRLRFPQDSVFRCSSVVQLVVNSTGPELKCYMHHASFRPYTDLTYPKPAKPEQILYVREDFPNPADTPYELNLTAIPNFVGQKTLKFNFTCQLKQKVPLDFESAIEFRDSLTLRGSPPKYAIIFNQGLMSVVTRTDVFSRVYEDVPDYNVHSPPQIFMIVASCQTNRIVWDVTIRWPIWKGQVLLKQFFQVTDNPCGDLDTIAIWESEEDIFECTRLEINTAKRTCFYFNCDPID